MCLTLNVYEDLGDLEATVSGKLVAAPTSNLQWIPVQVDIMPQDMHVF